MSTVEEVNKLALMAAAGLSGEQASQSLTTTVLITSGKDETSRFLADQLSLVLGKTLKIVFRRPADLHLSIEDHGPDLAPTRIHVEFGDHQIRFSAKADPSFGQVQSSHSRLFLKITACYLAGYAISHVAKGDRFAHVPDPFVVSLAGLGMRPEDTERSLAFDDTALAGGGGVANGFLWALASTKAQGRLYICDPKHVSTSNVNRCIYFDDEDVGQAKAAVLARKVRIDGLEIVPHVGDFGMLRRQRDKIRTVITTVDSRSARRSIRDELPLVVFDASTTDISEIVVFSERQPTPLACLSCTYAHLAEEDAFQKHLASTLGLDLDEVRAPLISEAVADKLVRNFPTVNRGALVGTALDSLYRTLCGEGTLLTAGGQQTLAPLGFISNLAGALLVVELLRVGRPGGAGSNYVALNPWRPPHRRARLEKHRKLDCSFCGRADIHALLASLWPGAYAPNEAHRAVGHD